jgi:hypothetical protein
MLPTRRSAMMLVPGARTRRPHDADTDGSEDGIEGVDECGVALPDEDPEAAGGVNVRGSSRARRR